MSRGRISASALVVASAWVVGCNLLTGVGSLDATDLDDAGLVPEASPAPTTTNTIAPPSDDASAVDASDAGIDRYVPPPLRTTGEFGGHRYEVVFAKLPWSNAKLAAEAKGGHLAVITSAEENEFCRQLSIDSGVWTDDTADGPWLGGFRERIDGGTPLDGWTWVTGETWSYAPWHENEPNDDGGKEGFLAYFGNAKAGAWNDYPEYAAGGLKGYLVEYE